MYIEFNRVFRDRLEMKSMPNNAKSFDNLVEKPKNLNLLVESVSNYVAGKIVDSVDPLNTPFTFADLNIELNKIDKS